MHVSRRTEQKRVFGNTARLGLIVPTTNTVNEAEWQMMLPADVTMHTARMDLHSVNVAASPGELPESLSTAMAQLTPASPHCIAYACTAGSLVAPPDTMSAAMSLRVSTPCTTTAAALVGALRVLRAKSVAIATPYHPALNGHESDFFTACGFKVTAADGLNIGAGGPEEYTEIAQLSLESVAAHARRVFERAPADALLLPCTDMPTLPLIANLEAELGVPVISSNTATLWASLRKANVDPREHPLNTFGGSLFELSRSIT